MAGALEIKSESDAIYNARTPFMDQFMAKYPSAELLTSGENVGLPDGQMGNSEVGHLNIGAGRIVYQELTTNQQVHSRRRIFRKSSFERSISTSKRHWKINSFHGIGFQRRSSQLSGTLACIV